MFVLGVNTFYWLLLWISWASWDIEKQQKYLSSKLERNKKNILNTVLREIQNQSSLNQNKIEEILSKLDKKEKIDLVNILKKKFISFFMNYSLNLNLKYYLQKKLQKNSQKKIFISIEDNKIILDFKEYVTLNESIKLEIKENGKMRFQVNLSSNNIITSTRLLDLTYQQAKSKFILVEDGARGIRDIALIRRIVENLNNFIKESLNLLKSKKIVNNTFAPNEQNKIILIFLYSSLRFNLKYNLEKCLFGFNYNRNKNTNKKFHSSHIENDKIIKLDLSSYFYSKSNNNSDSISKSNMNHEAELIINYTGSYDTIYLKFKNLKIPLRKDYANDKISLYIDTENFNYSSLNENIISKLSKFIDCFNGFIDMIYDEIKFDRLISGGSKIKSKNKILKEDLLKLCKKYKLKNYSGLKKDELIKLLKKNKKM